MLFLGLLVTLEVNDVREVRHFLEDQLASHAQDVATSLGLVLPPSLVTHDTVRLETTVGVVFDRGFYRSIRVVDSLGNTLLLRELPVTPPDVPTWFTHLVTLEVPSAQSLISQGWHQLGRVIVVSHPNFAYRQLWRTTWSTTAWMALFYGVALLLLHIFLRAILRPLKAIEKVAHEIGERRFGRIERMPKASELRNVVMAINTLSRKIGEIVTREVASAEHFRQEAYQDPLTGLANRRSFLEQLALLCRDRADQPVALYLIQLQGLGTLNASQGMHAGDQPLRELGRLLRDVDWQGTGTGARLGGSTFAVLVWQRDEAEARVFGQQLIDRVNRGLSQIAGLELGMGGLYLMPHTTADISRLLGDADNAVRQALTRPAGANFVWQHYDPHVTQPLGAEAWQGFMMRALAEQRLQLWAQGVWSLDVPGQLLHREITGSFVDETGHGITARTFIPMAIRQGIMAAVDWGFLSALFAHMAQFPLLAEGLLAVNLSAHSLQDEGLVQKLWGLLDQHPDWAHRLVFELTEFGVVHHYDRVVDWVAQLRQRGAHFAVDNFGFHANAFQYLQTLRPAYIKLATGYLDDLENHPENQFFIASVVRVARPLDILTLACGVENEARAALLRTLGVAGVQGFALSVPSLIEG